MALAASSGFILLSLSVFTRQVSHRDKLSYVVTQLKARDPHKQSPPPPSAGPPSRSHFPHLHIPWWLLAGLGEVALAGAVVLLVLLLTRVVPKLQHAKPAPKLPEPTPAPELPEQAVEQVVDTFDSAIRSLHRGHTRDAIIACWLRLEEVAGEAGAPKLASETSTESAGRWAVALSLRVAPLTELAELYREARFSSHEMSSKDSERARQALQLLRRDVADRLARADG